ncbi:hypothetical protein WG66_000148 [Moniliophthora roreri]|nr:hypothetical protein WG66_000148 [Moniliophthora roreri]
MDNNVPASSPSRSEITSLDLPTRSITPHDRLIGGVGAVLVGFNCRSRLDIAREAFGGMYREKRVLRKDLISLLLSFMKSPLHSTDKTVLFEVAANCGSPYDGYREML